jgi:hypothetical protein
VIFRQKTAGPAKLFRLFNYCPQNDSRAAYIRWTFERHSHLIHFSACAIKQQSQLMALSIEHYAA